MKKEKFNTFNILNNEEKQFRLFLVILFEGNEVPQKYFETKTIFLNVVLHFFICTFFENISYYFKSWRKLMISFLRHLRFISSKKKLIIKFKGKISKNNCWTNKMNISMVCAILLQFLILLCEFWKNIRNFDNEKRDYELHTY